MGVCRECEEPLLLQVADEESGGDDVVPDDLELPCGCHFHWQCLLDLSSEVAISLKCPACSAQLTVNAAGPSSTNQLLPTPSGVSIPTKYTSEGGVEENLDIMPAITEEAYLAANPEAVKARALHLMCGEGDVEGIMNLLREADQPDDDDDDDVPSMNTSQLIRYQDPLGHLKSALHVAVEKSQEEIVWLLLWIASPLPSHGFPDSIVAAAQSMGLQRPDLKPAEDIRSLQDDQGRTAEAVASQQGGVWASMVDAGVFHPSS